ncbi:MAG: thiamine-phosphate pyrophosphorylase [Candidatus Omnitrophica bacterium]|nr:thiamine-phosphate pyrophosphorylase [Candidatus Omnitrophota bacterium]
MTAKNINSLLYRMVDANYNRAKEALRVTEDIFRFCWKDKSLTAKAKRLRHALSSPLKNKPLLKKLHLARDSKKDIGRNVDRLELKRKDLTDILYANIQRAKESVRVLEESFKIIDKKSVYRFKSLRYNLYSFEKELSFRRFSKN